MPLIWGWYGRQLDEKAESLADLERRLPASQDAYEALFYERYLDRKKIEKERRYRESPRLGEAWAKYYGYGYEYDE